MVGFVNPSYVLTGGVYSSFAIGLGGTGWPWIFVNGTIAGEDTAPAAFAVGDVFCLDFDIGAQTIAVRLNGGSWFVTASTAALAGPFKFAWQSVTTGCAATVNFGGSAYAFTKPAGCSDWGG